MRPCVYKKPPLLRTLPYFRVNPIASSLKSNPYLCDLILIVLFAGLTLGLIVYFHRFSMPLEQAATIDLSFTALPKYTFFSMSRGLLGYCLSLAFSLVWGFWAAKDKAAERCLIPILDILQSIPILGFMPGLILLLVGLFPNSNTGLEFAAIVMIFTSQAWNMAFGVYHSIRIIPQDKIDCAASYRFSRWQKIKWLELPSTVISLIWNSIMSMAGGWFFLVVNEAFQLGNKDFRLPGLGSYMSVAANQGDIPAMIGAIVAMVTLIVFLDTVLWKPLVAWSQKFRVEETANQTPPCSLMLQVLTHSSLVGKLSQGIRGLIDLFPKGKLRAPKGTPSSKIFSHTCLGLLLTLVAIGLFFLLRQVTQIELGQWVELGKGTLLTLGRVLLCLLIGTLIALPLGLKVGLSETLSRRLEPLLQIAASFPATLLFPILILLLHKAGISLNIGSIVLMMMGTLWYILFNVIAGTKAIPTDLKEVSAVFKWKKTQRLFHFYLPAIFPYLITGLISAAGGAWNASIVAEYVTYQDELLTVPGIGSMIRLSAQNGQIPLLIASILSMSFVVVLINYQVWLRLYHYSEKRFSLNN
jgi:NitT/TauT family transport system permease protein